MKTKHFILGLFTLAISSGLFAQGFSVVPDNISGSAVNQLGNAVTDTQCNGKNTNLVKMRIKPSCYGQNLRGGGSTLNPQGPDIKMNVKITNSGDTFTSDVTFPAKITWPSNYGRTCDWNKDTKRLDCTHEGANVEYYCNHKKAKFFLNDYLDCRRIGDPLAHDNLNKNLSCLYMYSWGGQGSAATKSYKRIAGVANCGLRDKDEDFSPEVNVSNSVPAGSTDVFAKTRNLIVTMNGLNIKKQKSTLNMKTGEIEAQGPRSRVAVSFYQGGKKLTTKTKHAFDEYEQCLDISPAFLGDNQFCGSYYSPLMLFFDNKRPSFLGRSSFPIHPDTNLTHWVEKEAPGYFLALDKNEDGKINSGKELFGDGPSAQNGFEALRHHDSNDDLTIDSNDEVWDKLLLWKDENGDGVSQSNEIHPLSSKNVKSISLDYSLISDVYGLRAEAKQRATFQTSDKDGSLTTHKIEDIWFTPIYE